MNGLKGLVLNKWPYPNYFSSQTLSFVRPSPAEKKSEGGSTLCLKLKHVCISDIKTFLWDNIQGYPEKDETSKTTVQSWNSLFPCISDSLQLGIVIFKKIYVVFTVSSFMCNPECWITANNMPEAEFKEFEPRLKSAKTRFKLSAGLSLEIFDTILSGTKHI